MNDHIRLKDDYAAKLVDKVTDELEKELDLLAGDALTPQARARVVENVKELAEATRAVVEASRPVVG